MIFRRIYLTFFFIASSGLLYSQVRLKGASDIGNLKWWLGFKTGVTFSQVKVMERYAVLSDPADNDEKKVYSKPLKNAGQTIGLIFGYALTDKFLLSFQPAYSNYKYVYSTKRSWSNHLGESYSMNTSQNHRLGYIELPLLLLFRFTAGNFEPYVNAGGYVGILTGGRKRINYSENVVEGGILTEDVQSAEIIEMNKYLMKSQAGYCFGLGVSYTIQYFRIGLEASYKAGIYNMTNVKQRYTNRHVISRYFDVPDDLRLNNIDITVNLFMPVDNLIHLHSSQKTKGGRKQ